MTFVATLTKKLDAFDPLPAWLPKFATVGRYVVGLVFIFSGFAKVMDAQSLLAAMPAYQIPESLIPFLAILPPVEIVLGAQLIIGMAIGLTALESLALLLAFTVMLIVGMIGGDLESCGCFGSYLEMSPLMALLRNVALMALSFGILLHHRREPITYSHWQVGLISGIILIAGLRTGYTMESTPPDNSWAQVEEYFPDEGIIEGELPIDGQQLIFVFSTNCEHCWNSVANIKELAAGGDPPLIGLVPNNADDIEWFRKTFDVSFPILRYDPTTFGDAFNFWPALYMIEEGIILGKEEEDIPSLKVFREYTLRSWER